LGKLFYRVQTDPGKPVKTVNFENKSGKLRENFCLNPVLENWIFLPLLKIDS